MRTTIKPFAQEGEFVWKKHMIYRIGWPRSKENHKNERLAAVSEGSGPFYVEKHMFENITKNREPPKSGGKNRLKTEKMENQDVKNIL